MMGVKPLHLSVLISLWCTLIAQAQVPPVPTIQDCLGAIPICANIYVENQIPSGIGNYNDINPDISCLEFGEAGELFSEEETGSSVWYIFTVNNTGQFGFVISPLTPEDDYDFALFNLTNARCEDIRTDASLLVSCNYSSTAGDTGPNGGTNADSQGAGDSPFNNLITVQEGNTYALLVSNFTDSTDGYTLDFSLTDANTGIFDAQAPSLDFNDITFPSELCDREIRIEFSENIDCNSIAGFQTQLIGPSGRVYNTRPVTPECDLEATGIRYIGIDITPQPNEIGEYTFTIPFQDNANTIIDACGNSFFANLGSTDDLVFNFSLAGDLEVNIEQGDGDICQDGSLELAAKVDDAFFPFNYAITWSNGISGQGFQAPDKITITEPGTYSVTVSDQSGCNIGEAETIVAGGVNLDLGDDRTGLCASDGAQILDAGVANGYEWSTGETTRTISVTQTGTYSVMVTPDCGAPISDEIFIEFITDIDFNPTLEHFPCSTDIPHTIGEDIGSDFNYSWSNGSTNPTISVTEAGSYMVTVSNACAEAIRTITVEFEIVPAGGYEIEDFTICIGETTTRGFDMTAASTIAWVGPSGNSSNSMYDIDTPGAYGFVVNNACGDFEDSFEVLNGTPDAQITGDTRACEGEATNITASGGVSYRWSNGETTPTIEAMAGETYTVEVTGATGCTDSETITVTEDVLSGAGITGNPAFCAGESTTLSINGGSPSDTYLWSNGSTNNAITVNQAATYSITIRTAEGCEITDEVTVVENPRPNIIIINNAACNPSLADYDVSLTIPANSTLSVDDPLVIINENNGVYTLRAITGTSYTIMVQDDNTACSITQPITAPNCNCSNVALPVTNQNQVAYCIGTAIPSISASVEDNFEVLWYDVASGGQPLEIGNTFQPTQAGTYHAESRETVSGCVSGTRVAIEVIERALPQIGFSPDRMVCPDENLQLTATGGVTYNWSTGENNATITAVAGDYNITVTDGNNCQNEAMVSITEFVAPTASITGDNQFCTGGMTTLTASGGTSFSWSTGESNNSITVDQAGIVSVSITDTNGCQDDTSLDIIQNELPTFTTQQAAACSDDRTQYTITAILSPNTNLSISDGIIEENNGVYTITIPEGVNVEYTITNTQTGCSTMQTIAAPDCSCPVLAAPTGGQEFFYCPDEDLPMLTASANETGMEIRWYDVESGGAPIAMGNSFQPTQAGTYFAETVETASNCTSSTRLSVQVSERTQPAISFSDNRAVCPEGTLLLTANGGVSYIWNTTATSNAITVGVGTYSVTATDVNGCQNEASVDISEFVAPIASISGNNQFCAGDITNLTASGGTTFNWSTGENGSSIMLNQARTISVTVTDVNGCQDDTSLEVMQNELPTFTTQQAATCSDDRTEYTVTATLSPNTDLSISVGTVEESSGVYTLTIPEGINVEYTITNTQTDCAITQTISAPDCSCPVLAAPTGNQEVIYCEGSPIPSLNAFSAAAGTSIQWYDVANDGLPIATGGTFQPTQAGTYFAETLETSSGCTSSTRLSVQVVEQAGPIVTFNDDRMLCPGESLLLFASGGVSYQWSTGASGPSIIVGIGDYTVTATDANGCQSETTVSVTSFELPVAEISGNTNFCAGGETTLTASGGFIYEWNVTNEESETIIVNEAGEVRLTVTDENGCQDQTSVEIMENELPTLSTQQAATCNDDRTQYTVTATLSPNTDLSISAGSIEENNGVYTLTIPEGIDVEYTLTNTETGCTSTENITAPDCSCPVLAAPMGEQEFFYCPDEALPMLTASASEAGTEIRWYDVASSGAPIGTGNTFQPTQAGTYFAETVETASSCTSSTRLSVQVVERARPSISFSENRMVCPDETLLLTASGGVNYEWNTNAMSATITVGVGDYSVTATDGNGCQNEASVSIIEFAAPTASISGNAQFCGGEQTTLTASGGISYQWSTNAMSDIITINQAGTIGVTVTDSNGCQDETSIEVTQNELPTFTTQQAATCSDDRTEYTVTATLSPNTDLSISAGTVEENNGVYTLTIPEGVNVEYTVTNTQTGCAITQTISAPDCSCPVLAAPTGNQEVVYCEGSPIPSLNAFSAETGTSIQWYDVANGGLPIATGGTFQPTQAGTYYAETLEISSGCTSSTRLSVQVAEQAGPIVTFNDDRMLCPGESLLLFASGGVSYQWSTGASGPSIIVGIGDYIVTATDANGCQSETTVSVTSFELPVAEISGNTDFCAGGETTLTASGGFIYEWNVTNEESETITVNEAGEVRLTVTDENGCQDQTSVEIIENELPTLSTQQAATCNDDRTQYTVIGTLSADTEISVSTGMVEENNGVYTLTIPEGINVEYTLTNTQTGCTSTENITAPDCSCPVLAAPMGEQELFYCPDDALPILSATANEADTEIRWYEVESGGTAIATSNDFQPTQAGTYYAETVELVTNCTSSTRLRIQVSERARPSISFSEDRMVCTDETLLLTASGGTTYEWNTTESSASINAGAGAYSVTVTDENGCQNEAMVSISNFASTMAAIDGNATFCEGELTTLTANGGVSYQWSTGATNDIITVEQTEDISVTVTDSNGCEGEANISVMAEELPTFTTQQAALCSENLTEYTVVASISENASLTTSAGLVSENAGIYTITIPADISITVEVTNDMTGCSQSFPINAPDCSCPVLAAPISDGDTEICAGDALPNLTVSIENTTLSVNWFADAAATIPLATESLTYMPDAVGTYYAQTVELSSGCVSSQLTPVSVNELSLPIVSFSPDNQVCVGETLTLTASGGETYLWENGETTASINVGVGDYNVTITDANGCENEGSTSISEFAAAIASISGDENYCAGEQATLSGSGGILAWSTGESSEQILVESGEYMLTVTDENGCTDIATWTVTENELPNFTLVNSAACTPDLTEYTFSALIADNVAINLSAGTFAQASGEYSFTIPEGIDVQVSLMNSLTGCSASFDINAPDCDCPELAAPTSVGNVAICMGDAIPTLSVEGASEGIVVDWYDAPTGGTLLAEAISTFTPTQAGTYYASLREEASGCVSSLRTAITFTINELPAISITGDDAICANETSLLSASGTGDFVWNTNEIGNNITAMEGGTYSVTITDANACENVASFVVNAIESPVAEILDAPSTLCENEMVTLRTSGNGDYQWSTGETSNTINVNSEGTYSLTVTNAEGCSDMTNVVIALNDVNAIQLNLGEDTVLCEGESVLLDAGTFLDVDYTWQNGSTASTIEAMQAGAYSVTVTDACDNVYTDEINLTQVATLSNADVEVIVGQDTNLCRGALLLDISKLEVENVGTLNYTWTGGSSGEQFQIDEAGTYGLRMSNECGAAFADIEVSDCPECHIYVPNTFNPNSPLVQNQTFKPFFGSDCDIRNYHLRIMSRWGELVFETTDISAGWDGRFRSQNPVRGVYIWVMTYEQVDRYGTLREYTKTGDVTIFMD